jgi:hypothetical protein
MKNERCLSSRAAARESIVPKALRSNEHGLGERGLSEIPQWLSLVIMDAVWIDGGVGGGLPRGRCGTARPMCYLTGMVSKSDRLGIANYRLCCGQSVGEGSGYTGGAMAFVPASTRDC